MKDIPKWLAEGLPKLRKPVEDNQDFVTDAPMPDIYTDECAVTMPQLKVLDPGLSDGDEPPGIDPYDTGILQKK